jgi:hypothetical protein
MKPGVELPKRIPRRTAGLSSPQADRPANQSDELASRTSGLTPRIFEIHSALVNWNVPLGLASGETWSTV